MHNGVNFLGYKWNYPAVNNWVPGIEPQNTKSTGLPLGKSVGRSVRKQR